MFSRTCFSIFDGRILFTLLGGIGDIRINTDVEKKEFSGVQSLKIKETDRIAALKNECAKFGYLLTEPGEGLLAWNGERCSAQEEPVVATAGVATLNYGNFLQVTFDFLIVAICIFAFIKLLSSLKKKKEEAPAPAPAPEPTKEEILLTEIRDLLKNK